MRLRSLIVVALLALALPAANAAAAKSKVVHVVKRHGAITATLTYTADYQRVALTVRRHGRVVLRHRVPNGGPVKPSLSFRFVTGKREPAVVVDAYLSTAIALVSPRPAWIVHAWDRYGYRGARVDGRYYFDSSDWRFGCVYASCAEMWVPARIWAIKHERLAVVTRTVPTLVEADAHRAWHAYLRNRHDETRGVGILAGWCADEFTLGRGAHCEHVLRQKLKAGELKARYALSGRRFIRRLNLDLERWGYKQPQRFRVVKRQGAFTAILTYGKSHARNALSPVSDVTLRIRHGGRLVFRRQICALVHSSSGRCQWGDPTGLAVRRVGPSDKPAFVLDQWNDGNRCCTDTFIAVLGKRISWITHEWSGVNGWVGYEIKRSRGHAFFVTGDGRFFCRYSFCATDGSVPIRVFRIGRSNAFVNVTRHFPGLIRAHARGLAASGGPHATIKKQGVGVLAAWCADEYLLGRGARCSRTLAYAVRHHRPGMQGTVPTRRFVRGLNRDLERWGYKH